MKNKFCKPLRKGIFYHVYNRGIGQMPLFFQAENYHYFLNKLTVRIEPVCEIYAYCLLVNHFHLVIKIKEHGLAEAYENRLHQPFSNFFNGYAQAINKQENRSGPLFQRPFKRKEIYSETQLLRTIFYVHANPQKHKICRDFRKYKYSSFGQLSNPLIDSFISRDKLWDLHGGMGEFLRINNLGYEDLRLEMLGGYHVEQKTLSGL
ncbi:MAG: transposase [Bacteroidia bacterium]|nr:transposase [Bacteroidia bacterium]